MKWKEILNQKTNTRLALIIVLIMMLLLSFVHKRNISDLQGALSSIHQDRLVAESHLYKLSHAVYEKKLSLDKYDASLAEYHHVLANDTIHQLIKKFEETTLTTDEASQLAALKDLVRVAQQFELQFAYLDTDVESKAIVHSLANQYDLILSALNGLTTLQLYEGQKLIDQSNRIVASNNLTSRMEVGLFIVSALLIFLLLSTVPSYRNIDTPSLN